MTISAVRLDAARIERASGVLAQAFHDYPLFRALLPEEKRRARALRWYMGFILRYCTTYGEVLTTADDEGLLTYLTGHRPFTRRRLLAAGLLLGPLRMGVRPFWRMMQHNNYVGSVISRFVPHDAWYLWIVGVDPAAQRKRLGWKLMNRFLPAADAAGAACYGDTDRREMLGFLLFHGFEVVHEGRVPTNDLPFWVVYRPARAGR